MYKESYKQSRLTMLQHIIYEQQIEFNNYTTDYPIKRYNYKNTKNIRTDKAIFNDKLKAVNKIIKLLKINCNYMYIEEYNKKTYYYIFKNKLTFSIENLTIKQKQEYKLEIIFLYLYTNKYLTPNLLKKHFNHTKHQTYVTMKQLKEVIRGTIKKENNIYELERY